MKLIWRLCKFILGVLFVITGCYSYIYVNNNNIAGYASGVKFRNQELIGTGILVGLGMLLIYSSFKNKVTQLDKPDE